MKRLVPTVWGFTRSRLAASPTAVVLLVVGLRCWRGLINPQSRHTRTPHATTQRSTHNPQPTIYTIRTVGDLDEVLGVDEEVARLDVPVDLSLRVQVVEAPEDVVGDLGQQLLVARAALVHQVLLICTYMVGW